MKLRDPNIRVRRYALDILNEVADERAVESLIEALKNPDDLIRMGAARALGRIGGLRTGEALLKALRDKNPNVRKNVVTSLAAIGEQRAVQPLILSLKDEDEAVRGEASAALGKVGDASAVKPLVDHCLSYSPQGGYRNDPNSPYYEQNRAIGWVTPLEELLKRLSTDIALDDLRQLLDLKNRTYHLRVEYDTPGYGDGADDFVVELDFSKIRQLVTEELRRRGLER